MKNGQDETKILAAKLLAHLLVEETPASGADDKTLSAVLSKLDDLSSRLVKIENRLSDTPAQPTSPTNFPFTTFPVALHPSRDKFAVEDSAGVSADKTCHFEPGNKPCDYCSMCSSRGF